VSDLPKSAPLASDAASEATRGSAIKLATELLARLVYFATTFLISIHYGVEGFGRFGWSLEIAVVLAEAADLGLQGLAAQALVARTLSLAAVLRAKAAASGVVLLLALLALPGAPLLAPLVVFFVLAGWSELLGVALRARGARLSESAVIFALRASALVLVTVAIGAGADLTGLAWAHAASPVLSILIGAWLLVRTRAGDEGPDPGIGPVLRRSAPLAVNGGLALVSPRVEFLAMGFLAGQYQAGLFLAALRVVQFLNVVPSAIAAGAMPSLTREAVQRTGDPVRRRTSATLAFLALPAAAGVALLAPGLIVLFGAGFGAAAPALRIMALAAVPLFFNSGLVTSALIAAERSARLPRLTAVRVVAALAFAAVLVPRFGAVGGAIGFLLSESLFLGLGARACRDGGFAVSVAGGAARAAVATVPMALFVALVPASLPVSVGGGIVAYGLTLVLGRSWAPALLRDLGGDVRYAEDGKVPR
jgi:O-antigen/teichoic acid export membrane protein